MRKNLVDFSIPFRVVKPLALGLLLVGLVACATAPIDKARLQADKDWARAVASAEKYQQLQRMMLQESSPPATTPLAPAPSPAAPQAVQPLLTPEEHRRQEIEQREKVYADEWRVLEHDVTKRVLQRGLQELEAPKPLNLSSADPPVAGRSSCREWKLRDWHWEKRWDPSYGRWQTVLVERWGWIGMPCNK